jgi:hypothetical protein
MPQPNKPCATYGCTVLVFSDEHRCYRHTAPFYQYPEVVVVPKEAAKVKQDENFEFPEPSLDDFEF